MSRNRIVWWAVEALIVIVVFAYPARITVAPAYRVTLVDEFNKPMAAAPVSELWWQTSAERRQHLEQGMTDTGGNVSFPARTMRSALLERMIGCLAYLGREGLAASCGSQFSISAAGDVKELMRRDVKMSTFPSRYALRLMVKPCDPEQPAIC